MRLRNWLLGAGLLAAGWMLAQSPSASDARLWEYRNLGKAFYENPTTQVQAVDEFKKALDLAPHSVRERINYGLALLRAGKTAEGIAELEKAQKQDPSNPYTWFNLGIAFKKDGDYERATTQLQQMAKLVPDEPITHYNLGVLYKLAGKRGEAIRQFETASRLNENLAGPHFQLYNAYRQAGRAADAARQLQEFEAIKKKTAGAAVPEDMEWSYFAEIYDPIPARVESAPPGPWKFEDRRVASGLDAATAGMVALDADGDGKPDLLVWSSQGIELYRNGVTPVPASGLAGIRDVIAVAPGDFDNDGFPDLCVVSAGGAQLYHNQKGTFQKVSAALPPGHYAKAVWLDFDHDYDLDLFLLGDRSVLLRNNGPAGFSDFTSAFPFVPGRALDAAPLNLIADAKGMDLAVTYAGRPGVIYRDQLLGKFQALPEPALPSGARGLRAYDLNNDHWMDLAASGLLLLNDHGALKPQSAPPGPFAIADVDDRGIADWIASGALYHNDGLGKLTKGSAALPAAAALVHADFDNDGHPDVALVAPDGSLHLLRSLPPAANRWIAVELSGIKNLKLAAEALVEIKAGTSYQERLYHGVPLLFGIGPRASIDTVRITWPNGLIQNEPQQPTGKLIDYKEAQRLSGSCPMIFTWNGSRFQFITDVLGVAPLGASSGDGSYFPVDHDEYVQVPGRALAPVHGRYDVRITEELHEVSYIDQVKLIAVDHPAGTDIYTNDKFKSPPYPGFRLFGVTRRIYPRAARDQQGRNVLDRLLRRDQRYPDGFRRDYSGIAEMHHLDLDFGAAAPDNRAVLILNGWVDWADGSTFMSAAQAHKDLVLPYLQVKDAAGKWRTVIQDMGIPAGKPKTIAVDLTGKFLSASRQVRIVTNLCVYWDEIFLGESAAPPHVRLTELQPLAADLEFRGFSRPHIDPQRKQPESFDYQQWMPFSSWNPTPGMYTRYGDVLPLVRGIDDELVIMGSGDEMRLSWKAAAPPAPGWQRDFLLFVDGWAKDADANTAFSQTVEPLPFHGMSGYPYPPNEHFPEDAAHRRWRQRYNTRPALRLFRPLLSGTGPWPVQALSR